MADFIKAVKMVDFNRAVNLTANFLDANPRIFFLSVWEEFHPSKSKSFNSDILKTTMVLYFHYPSYLNKSEVTSF